jgi:hypothetical protein
MDNVPAGKVSSPGKSRVAVRHQPMDSHPFRTLLLDGLSACLNNGSRYASTMDQIRIRGVNNCIHPFLGNVPPGQLDLMLPI